MADFFNEIGHGIFVVFAAKFCCLVFVLQYQSVARFVRVSDGLRFCLLISHSPKSLHPFLMHFRQHRH